MSSVTMIRESHTMKRRVFGLLAGTSFATAAALRPTGASAATQDAALLTTVLTPLGAERAGNADGSIPAWTGGLTAPPLPAGTPAGVQLFTDEQPLYTIDASNMAQYQALLTPATQIQIKQWGAVINVFPTHRTAAAPQYVYDNTAKNVTTAQLDPRGGRFGFTGAYGGVPFPIIDTSDPLAGGAQLIWNHLTAWSGFSTMTSFNPGSVVIKGAMSLQSGTLSRTIYPYYDPNGSLENFEGYFSKGHYYTLAPGSAQGGEILVWHSCNVNVHPDIIWELLNGQGRVRKAPDMQYDIPSPGSDGISNIDEASCFNGNPSQYDWRYIGKQEMLVPYNCNKMLAHTLAENLAPHFPNADILRWEKHRVWVVEATLHPGERNVNARRRLYIDEDTWSALLGEGYDADGNMVKAYALYNNCVPSLPGTIEQGTAVFNLQTGDYGFDGNISDPPYDGRQYLDPQPVTDFDPQEMSANASF
jgi:hypothetical protein